MQHLFYFTLHETTALRRHHLIQLKIWSVYVTSRPWSPAEADFRIDSIHDRELSLLLLTM